MWRLTREDKVLKPAEFLEQVDRAICGVLVGGQSYRIGNRSLTRADLSMLKKLRDDLAAQVQAGENGQLFPGTYTAFFEGS